MDDKLVPFAMKPATLITIGENQKEFHSGCSVFDITFPHVYSVEICEIHFRNYYTHWVQLKARFQDKTKVAGEGNWRTCVRRIELMPNAHSDLASEQYFTISAKQMLFPLNNIIGLRFILRQPSPLWKEFRLDDIRLCKKVLPAKGDSSMLSENVSKIIDSSKHKRDETTSTSLSALSEHLQHLWALSQQAAEVQTTQRLGRFDVDGNYDISLLSYN